MSLQHVSADDLIWTPPETTRPVARISSTPAVSLRTRSARLRRLGRADSRRAPARRPHTKRPAATNVKEAFVSMSVSRRGRHHPVMRTLPPLLPLLLQLDLTLICYRQRTCRHWRRRHRGTVCQTPVRVFDVCSRRHRKQQLRRKKRSEIAPRPILLQ